MGLFSGLKKNKTAAGNPPTPAAPAGGSPAPKQSRHKYHSRRKKSNLIQDMKINGSVPTTIIDAIHGDKSIISSDQDFVRAPKIALNGRTYYPVFIMDEDTFEKAGIDQPQNRKTYGQLSNGLKTSSGATGLLPIVTEQSSKENYFAILPMNDAFEFLNSKPVFADYRPGWLVGLLNIDNDSLDLEKTNVRLTMAQWMQFIKGDLNFKVENGQLSMATDVPETSDPLAFSGAEDGRDATSAATQAQKQQANQQPPAGGGSPLDEFDEPESSSAPQNNQNNQPPANGYSIDDIPVGAPEDDGPVQQRVEPTSKPAGGNGGIELAPQNQGNQPIPNNNPQPQPVANQAPVQPNNNQVNQQQLQQQQQQNAQRQQQLQDQQRLMQQQQQLQQQQQNAQRQQQLQQQQQQVAIQNNNAIKMTQSQDELTADNNTLTATVRTLNDLNIRISDQEFIDAYLKPLRVNPIPLEDESNDPTGRIHHVNELRRQANLELQSSENTAKARLRQWFETERAGELDALNEGVEKNGDAIANQRERLQAYQRSLNNIEGLKAMAQRQIQAKIDEMDQRFAKSHQNELEMAKNEVDSRFDQMQVQLDQQKDSLLQQGIAQERQRIARQITDTKNKIQQIAQTAASKGYMTIMEQGAGEYRKTQQALDKLHHKLIHHISVYEKESRDKENQRVADEAVIAKNDTTIQTLREQMAKANSDHQNDLARQGREYQRNLEDFKTKAAQDQKVALDRMKQDVDDFKQQRDQAIANSSKQSSTYDELLNKQRDDYVKKMTELRNDMQDSDRKTDQLLKRMRLLAGMAVVMGALLGGLIGFFSGSNSAYRQQAQTQRTTQSPAPIYQISPQYSQTSSSSSSQASSSSDSSSSSTTSHDKNASSSSSHKTSDKK